VGIAESAKILIYSNGTGYRKDQHMSERHVLHEIIDEPPRERQLIELQRRYEQLTVQEKERVNGYLSNIYEILGVVPGGRLAEGENYFQLFEYLLTNINDLIPRMGRVEQAIEKIFAMLSTQTDTVTVNKSGHTPEKFISTHGLEMWADAEGNLLTGDSDSDMSVSMGRESDSSTQSTHMSYRDVRYARSLYPGLPVKEFCAKFGISEQSYYRAMRKGK
jgi:hypothetical protein